MHHGQAQARSLAHGLGGEEGLEDALQRARIHAGAVVLHRQRHVADGWQAQALAQALVGAHQVGVHLDQAAPLTQGVHGVGAQVEQGLLHLHGVGQHGGQLRRHMHLQLHGGRQRHAQQPRRVAHDFARLHGLALGRLVAAEGQDLAHQVARAASGLFDLLQAFDGCGIAAAVGLGQLHIAQDGAHDVVEVVGNAAGHGAQGLHLVRFAQLVFQLVALGLGLLAAGEVAREHGGGLAAAVVLEGDADLDRDFAAAGRACRHLAQHGLRGQWRKGQGLGRIGQETLQRTAQRVVRRTQKQGGSRGIEDGDALLVVQADDGVQGRVDDRFEPPLAQE